MSWIQVLKEYIPYNSQEKADQEILLKACQEETNLLNRENKKNHFSSSGFIVNPEKDKVLMVHHLIYDIYAWTGGHMDGEEDFVAVALREAMEETGVQKIKRISDIISIDILPVPAHIKNGQPVEKHDHFNITYLLEAEENQTLSIKEDENSDVRWIALNELEKWVDSKEMMIIYNKIIERLNQLK